jgi:hypothetical protein
MTNEITAFSLDEARRLVARWRAKADDYVTAGQDAELYGDEEAIGYYASKCFTLRQSADELEAILPVTPCPHCDGTGQRVGEHNGFVTWYEPCVECDGKGKAK